VECEGVRGVWVMVRLYTPKERKGRRLSKRGLTGIWRGYAFYGVILLAFPAWADGGFLSIQRRRYVFWTENGNGNGN
jgi:hypothetical protein